MHAAQLLLSLLPLASALSIPSLELISRDVPLPLIMWHGLGDQHTNPGLHEIGDLVREVWPHTYVHYVHLDDDGDADRKASFFGNVTGQIAQVCNTLHADDNLLGASPGDNNSTIVADALGFSQGGQFLRGLVEQCPGLRVRSLVTFGSQHNGIADVKPCGTWDLLCKAAIGLLRGNVWSQTVQGQVVPAQYFRTVDPETNEASAEYLESSGWLAAVNNERVADRKEKYKERLSTLTRFVMFIFADDTTVVPKESGWFAEINATSKQVIPLQSRKLYKEDWLGLKELDKAGKLVFEAHPGDHMQLKQEILRETFKKYYGPERELDAVTRLMPEQLRPWMDVADKDDVDEYDDGTYTPPFICGTPEIERRIRDAPWYLKLWAWLTGRDVLTLLGEDGKDSWVPWASDL